MSDGWWQLPGEVCLSLPHVPLRVTYLSDDGTCWEFGVQSARGESRFRWHHEDGRLLWPETQQIAETLRSPLALLCETVGAHIRPPSAGTVDRTILDAVAAAAEETTYVTGRRLRTGMPHVSIKQFRDAVSRLEPRFLLSSHDPYNEETDAYTATFAGLVNSRQALLVDRIVEAVLAQFCDKFRKNPDFSQFTLDEVFERGRFAPEEKRFVNFVISAARFGHGGGGSETPGSRDKILYAWTTPPWVENLVRMSTTKDYLAYLRAGFKRLPSPTSPMVLGPREVDLVERSTRKNSREPRETKQKSKIDGENMTRQIFISHSAKDKQLAHLLVGLIEGSFVVPDEGIRCTSVDGYALAPGERSDDVLKKNLRECAMLIALLTRDSLLSAWVTMELGAAWILDKPSCAILAPEVAFSDIHGPLSGNHAIKLGHQAGIANMAEVVGKHTGWPKRNSARSASALQHFMEQAKGLFVSSKPE